MAAWANISSLWSSWSAQVSGSKELAEIVARGNQTREGLEPAERLRYDAYVMSYVESLESTYQLGRLAEVDDEELCFVWRDYGILVTDARTARGIRGATIPPDLPLGVDSGRRRRKR